MTDAIAQPTRRARRELHSTDHTPPQASDIILPDGPLDREPDVVIAPGGIDKDYVEALKFAEEPVTILLHESSEENAPPHQECWVNGRGIEFLFDSGWRVNWPGVAPGYAPCGQTFTTKRKYVEVLARKRVDKIKTIHDDTNVENPRNMVRRQTVSQAQFSIVRDDNPKGVEWFRRLMAS